MAYNPLAFGQVLVAMGSLIFAAYLYYRFKDNHHLDSGFAGVFILLGIVASVFGFGLFTSEPIPGHYIEIYGVGYMVFTMLMLILGASLIFKWDLRPASYLAFIGGIALLNCAYTIWHFQLSKFPLATTAIFALAGIGAAGSVYMTHGKHNPKLLLLGMAIFIIFGILALYSGMQAQIGHVASALAL